MWGTNMANIFGGSGALGGLEELLGGGKGGVAALLPSLIQMLGSGGLDELMKGFGANGLGDIIGSWIGTGPNKKVTPGQVKKGVGKSRMKHFAEQSGLPENEVAKQLANLLPHVVNTLTPEGKVPEASGLLKSLQGIQGMLK
jgi:uncharacterized protein YidB (DUF937 family)